MKVVAFNGSPRKNGNTSIALQMVLDELGKENIETELVQFGSEGIEDCTACLACVKNKDMKCIIESDNVNVYIEKMIEADGVILGSPVYFGNVTGQMKAFIDRVGYVSRVNGDPFKRKVGAAVTVNRRAGALAAFADINYFFLIGQWIVVGSNYWNVGAGHKPGDILNDQEAINVLKKLAENMAWLLKKLSD
ncbi:MAG: flavodoxin family protein [Methanomassiliicoccales archaeon]|nr:flavodoxin family protein [Methanomassiliicoccales archaeon]